VYQRRSRESQGRSCPRQHIASRSLCGHRSSQSSDRTVPSLKGREHLEEEKKSATEERYTAVAARDLSFELLYLPNGTDDLITSCQYLQFLHSAERTVNNLSKKFLRRVVAHEIFNLVQKERKGHLRVRSPLKRRLSFSILLLLSAFLF
jgi:hypothetical protein